MKADAAALAPQHRPAAAPNLGCLVMPAESQRDAKPGGAITVAIRAIIRGITVTIRPVLTAMG